MELDAFVKETKSDVDRFKEMWADGHAKDPSAFPAEMGEGDWFDQFMLFINCDA